MNSVLVGGDFRSVVKYECFELFFVMESAKNKSNELYTLEMDKIHYPSYNVPNPHGCQRAFLLLTPNGTGVLCVVLIQ